MRWRTDKTAYQYIITVLEIYPIKLTYPTLSAMDKSQESALNSPQSTTATIRSLADSARECLESFLPLAVMEGKKAGMGLIVMFGFGVGAFVLLIAGWLTCVARMPSCSLRGKQYA